MKARTRWWQRRREMLEPIPVPTPYVPWEVKGYKDASKLIRNVWALHSKIRIGGQFGSSGLGDTFWCEGCSQQWPCATARLVINWGQLDHPDYEPLRLIETGIERHPDAEKLAPLSHSQMQELDPTIVGSTTKASDPGRKVLRHSDGRRTWIPA